MLHTLTTTSTSPLSKELQRLRTALRDTDDSLKLCLTLQERQEIGYGAILTLYPKPCETKTLIISLSTLHNTYPFLLTAILEAIADKKKGLRIDIPNNHHTNAAPNIQRSSHMHIAAVPNLIAWFSS